MFACVYLYIFEPTHMHICAMVCRCARVYVCTYLFLHLCKCVLRCVCVDICVCTCIHECVGCRMHVWEIYRCVHVCLGSCVRCEYKCVHGNQKTSAQPKHSKPQLDQQSLRWDSHLWILDPVTSPDWNVTLPVIQGWTKIVSYVNFLSWLNSFQVFRHLHRRLNILTSIYFPSLAHLTRMLEFTHSTPAEPVCCL